MSDVHTQQLVAPHAQKKVYLNGIRGGTGWLSTQTDENDLIEAVVPSLPGTQVEDLAGKTICGIVLTVKHGTATKYKVFERNNHSQFSHNIAAKRQRILQTAPYDRLMICADVSGATSGACFALVFANHDESRKALRYVSGDIGVGSLIYIGEPKQQDKTLGELMPIVKTTWPIQPLYMTDAQAVANFCPETSFKVPSASGDSRYFMFHNKNIKVCMFNLLYETVSCSGKFCDRAQVLYGNVACGCMQVGFTRTPVVGEFTVRMKLPSLDGSGQEDDFVVHDFRSLRTTNLFFKNLQDYSSQDGSTIEANTRANREKVTIMVDHINNSGGWSVCGWFRKGEFQDASTQEQKVDNDDVTLHISLLVPTSPKYSNTTDADFVALQIERQAGGAAAI